jgi:hypothetical protein
VGALLLAGAWGRPELGPGRERRGRSRRDRGASGTPVSRPLSATLWPAGDDRRQPPVVAPRGGGGPCVSWSGWADSRGGRAAGRALRKALRGRPAQGGGR